MIPKVIHYCWFGRGKMPHLAVKCIESWRKFLPDYEIKEWNEDNFDVNIIPYTAEAYKAKKYAFVSDYARFWVLYNYGGIYFDTDVEVIKPMDDIIERGAFMGIETKNPILVAPGLCLGVEAGNLIYKEVLDKYENGINQVSNFDKGYIVPFTTLILKSHGLKDENTIQRVEDISIYPKSYFNPYDYVTGDLNICSETRTIHWFGGSWMSRTKRIKLLLGRIARKLIWK